MTGRERILCESGHELRLIARSWDRGQPCVCTERGPCAMHADVERADAAVDAFERVRLAAKAVLYERESDELWDELREAIDACG